MKPIAEAVLEGLIHNLRTPLNLILGYAQKLHDEEGYAHRIYDAGIRMDDQLQQTWEALQFRMSDTRPTELNAWLQNEIILLNSVLPIKHQFCLTAVYSDKPVYINASSKILGEKLVCTLESLKKDAGMMDIKIVISADGLSLHTKSEQLMIWTLETDA